LDRLYRVYHARHYMRRDLSFHDLLEHGQRISDALAHGDRWVELPERGVVDFIVVFIAPGRRWPAFNVADVALCVGASLLIAWLWRHAEDTAPDAS